MKNTDISVNKRFYRGNASYIVHWTSNGFPDQRDFGSAEEADEFADKLKLENQPNEVKGGWTEKTSELLKKLELSPDGLNEFLLELSEKAKHGFGKWREYVDQSIEMRGQLTRLAFKQSLSIEDYLQKLELFMDAPIDKVVETYESSVKAQKATEEVLGAYIDRLRLEEDDEDEIEFKERKLTRFLESFGYNIFSIDDADILKFLSEQKGSDSAKKRLEEIVFDFKAFAEKRTSATIA